MTPIPSSYLTRNIYRQTWEDPARTAHEDTAPHLGEWAWWRTARAALRSGLGSLVSPQPPRLQLRGGQAS